jgi:hypothetical protein
MPKPTPVPTIVIPTKAKNQACFTMAIASYLVAHSAAMLGPRASAAINDATDSEIAVRGIMIFFLSGSNARSSTRKLGARLSPRRRALVDRFAKSRDGGCDHSVLSWAVPFMGWLGHVLVLFSVGALPGCVYRKPFPHCLAERIA